MAQSNWWEAAPVVTAKGGPLPSPPKAPDKPNAPPSGYRFRADGTLEAIPGGPADPSTKPGGTEKPSQVPVTAEKDARGQVGQFTALQTARDTFEDDFGGNLLGGAENVLQAISPVEVGTPGQREWWAAFKATDNMIRNDLFGAALTATEKAAYEATTVSPGMQPDIIKQNLTRRTQIIQDALTRQRDFMVKNGYRPEAVDAIFAPILQKQQTLAETAPKEDDASPPPPMEYNPADPGQRPIAGAGLDSGGDGGTQIATGADKRVDNPVLAGVRAEYARRLARGDTAEQLTEWALSAGVSPSAKASIAAQVEFRRKNPKVPIEQYDTSQLDDMPAPVSSFEQAMGSAALSPVGAGLISSADAASGFTLDNIVGATGGNAERARLGMDQIAQANPKASLFGTVAGGVGAALGMEGALAGRGIAAGLGRSLGADALYGGVAGAGATDYNSEGGPASLQDRMLGGVKGAGAGVAGGYMGSKVAGGLGRIARGSDDVSVRAVRDEGIPLTIGQQYGQSGRIGAAIKGAEDRLAGLPVVGDMINARRMEGVEKFNSAAFDRALKPIKGTVSGKVGEEAMVAADDAVSKAYNRALGGKVANADPKFAADITTSVRNVMGLARVGGEVSDGVREILEPYMRPGVTQITGNAMQQISRELRKLKAGYGADPMSSRIGNAVDGVEDAVFGLFRRQTPEVLPAYNRAKLAAQRLYTIERAVLAGKNTDGVFTPAQLGTADRAATIAYGGRRAASTGRGQFHDMQRAAQNVMPNKVPDSGTAGRILVPAVLMGGGAGIDSQTGGVQGLTLGTILAGAYTKAGQRLLTKPGRGMNGVTGKVLKSEATRKAITAGAGAGGVSLSIP